MSRPTVCIVMAAGLFALAACKGKPPSGQEPANVAAPAPSASSASADSAAATGPADGAGAFLTLYVGKHPSDILSGRTFLDQPLVKAAVEQTVPDAAARDFIFHYGGPDAPIAEKNGRLLAWGCERHNCGYHNWAISIAPDGSAPEICVYRDDKRADGTSRWFLAGGRSETRPGNCPSE